MLSFIFELGLCMAYFYYGQLLLRPLENFLQTAMASFPNVEVVIHVDGRDDVFAARAESNVVPRKPVYDVLELVLDLDAHVVEDQFLVVKVW